MSGLAKYLPPSVAQKVQNMSNRLARSREEKQEQMARVQRTATVMGTGAALGYLKGRYDRTEIMGAPLAPAVGVTAHIFGFANPGGNAELAHSIGDACLTVHAAQVGEEMGRDRKAKLNGGGAAVGFFPTGY